jgi:hypothetical protein
MDRKANLLSELIELNFSRIITNIFFNDKILTVDWKKLHNDGLNNLYTSPGDEMGRICSTNEGDEERI